MKKILAFALVLVLALSMTACSGKGGSKEDPTKKSEGVMTYAEYDAAALDSEVVIETYVQAKQGWWEDNGQGKATLYTQDGDGAYFIYNAYISEADYNKLGEGQKIKVTGYKAEWSGEVEIAEGATIEIEDGKWVAEAVDITDKLGTDELIKYQNQKIVVKGAVVESKEDGAAFWYNWDNSGVQGDDIYFDVSANMGTYSFTLESYLTGKDTDVYKAAEALEAGKTIDVEGYLYWYEGPQPHVTKITVK